MRFRHFVIQRFCLFREFAKKTKSLNDKMAKTHFFWPNSIFSLRLTPFRARSLKFCFVRSYFELCPTLKHEKSIFFKLGQLCGAHEFVRPTKSAELEKNWLFMFYCRTEVKIALYEAKFQTATPEGRQTQGKNRIRPNKMRFRHFVIQQFCLFQAKDKIVGWQNVENAFFWSNSTFFLASIAPKGLAIR